MGPTVEKRDIECGFLLDDLTCQAISEDEEGRLTREEFCINKLKNACCYFCANQRSCETSCNYLDKSVDMSHARTGFGELATPESEQYINREVMEFIGEYIGGHPAFPVNENVRLTLWAQSLEIPELGLSIPYQDIKRVGNMTKKKIAVTRIIFLGVIGALWKKEQLFMVLTYQDKVAETDLSMVFRMDKIEEVQPLIYQRMVHAKTKK